MSDLSSYHIRKGSLAEILTLRNLYLQEMNAQIRYHACHERGWSDSYVVLHDDNTVGYGSVKGLQELTDRDALFEFYLLPGHRHNRLSLVRRLLHTARCTYIEAQSNDLQFAKLLVNLCTEINSDTLLFGAGPITDLHIPGAIFRKVHDQDDVFGKNKADWGAYVIEFDNQVVADGGFLLHYNAPFADLYMETRKDMQRKGFGSLMIQEVKRVCYLAGRVPAARCSRTNEASRLTLLRGGLTQVGEMLRGRVNTLA